MNGKHFQHLAYVLAQPPHAIADISGSSSFPQIRGKVCFWQTQQGVLVLSEVLGLPSSQNRCESRVFAYHIHEASRCTGSKNDAFSDVGAHFNPQGCPHPHHAGDLPPLFESGGYAFSAFLTNRFTAEEIIGKTIIIHSMPDDFTTQPAGNAGEKIACGEIGAVPIAIG